MPFAIPTLQALAQRAANAFRANLKGSDARLWPNNVSASAKVIGAAVWESFSFLDYISRQINKSTAEGIWLERHAYDYGLARLAATFATGQATLSGVAGTVVPAGLVLQRADGVQYETIASASVPIGTVIEIAVRALKAGRGGNAVSGVALFLTAPFAGIEPDALVAATGIGTGADVEGDESLRARLLHRLRLPPHGGASFDYIAWAREINGVTRVFVDPVTADNGRTSVGVYFLMDDIYADGIPQDADVAAVAAYIDSQRPAGALVAVTKPTPVSVSIRIAGLSPNTVAVRDAIAAEVADMFAREVKVSTLTDPFTLYRSLITEAISIATGEHHHTLVAPAIDVRYALGEVPVLGSITYV